MVTLAPVDVIGLGGTIDGQVTAGCHEGHCDEHRPRHPEE